VLPTTAQVASQKANYLVKHFNAGDPNTTTDFAFKNFGALAYLGGWRAIMQGESQNVKG
jgi:NADH dehydrogenase